MDVLISDRWTMDKQKGNFNKDVRNMAKNPVEFYKQMISKFLSEETDSAVFQQWNSIVSTRSWIRHFGSIKINTMRIVCP